MLMQLHLILKISLASNVDIVREYLLQVLCKDSAKRAQYTTNVLFSHSTVVKEIFIDVIQIYCK